MLWYNVNGSGTGNRTFTLNVGATDINLNRLDGPDGLAMQDRWQHVAAVMRGQNRIPITMESLLLNRLVRTTWLP